jgi:UDP-glucose 4-epimerase
MSGILITGGLGYIGSFTARKILKQTKSKVLSIDNLSRGNKFASKYSINKKLNISNKNVKKLLIQKKINIVIHLASLTCVRESLKKPKKYYEDFKAQLKFVKCLKDTKVNYLIFSSSLSIFDEDKYKSNLSPYSKYKFKLEKYLKKISSPSFKVIILRYPNIIGSDPSGELGERNFFISRIMPLFYKNLIKEKYTNLFYNFKTKTFPKRNYLHVEDIANINYSIVKNIKKFKRNCNIFNLSGKKQYSNFEVLKFISKMLNKKPQYILKKISSRESMIQIDNSKTSIFNYINYKIKYVNLAKIIQTNLKWFKKIY